MLASVPDYGFTVASARQLLLDLKNDRVLNLRFLADDQDVLQLPDWVVTASQTTDGHLLQLAQAHGAALATLDQKIPGAYLIPA
ncbi:MAG TPA: hypothetical protein VE545_02800 [Candidatus Dormibacteraeota bacterium]|nr:hypothetical protein [Candidatus Dormibacteraeota bacterium]